MTPRPFADAVLAYAQAGWPCIFPVPVEKHPPPVGFTGADGRDTDPMQLAVWAGTHAGWSIAIRMPDGVIGIDVDAYIKGSVVKHGAESLAAALERWGPLPATWSSTARGAGPSRVNFYRVPDGRYATKLPGGDVEILQRHHRYAVVWPSPHVDAGDIYRWYDPAGQITEQPPKPDELPELPQAWVDGLREGASSAGYAMAAYASGESMLAALLADTRPACAEITSTEMRALQELNKVDAGSRHDTAVARVHHLVQLAAAGHPGLAHAIEALADRWADLTAGEGREEEWQRMLLTSARKAVTAVGAQPVPSDPCLIIGGLTIQAPAPAWLPSDPADSAAPIEPPTTWHPLGVIGTQLFDPRGHLDQMLAEATLERAWPLVRYATDKKTWLRRGPEQWEDLGDLAEWLVSLLANLMPMGDPDAEKGSDARDQAERRKRFMSASTAGAISKKMRSLVAGGSHPAALRIGDLDAEPWLLWAGGIGWDLRASLEAPTPAQIDPATPHLHAAGVRPDIRPTPLWDAFLAAVWPDPELRAWALRVLSITLTGYSDKALPVMLGGPDRGKTQVVRLISSVLGSYAHSADPRLLNNADNAHASIVYALHGRRLSFIDEAPRSGNSAQERLKQLTGGGELTGNAMRSDPVTFRPTHTLVLTANDEPLLTDPAVRRRVRLIPCEGDPAEVIAARAAIGDTAGAAWRREAPGVLAMMMREAAAWLADQTTGYTAAAPEAYRYLAEEIAAEQDPVTDWLREETEPHDAGERSRVLFEAFVGWCKNGNVPPSRILSETKWGRELTNRGYPSRHTEHGKRRALRLRTAGGWAQFTPMPAPTADGFGSPSQTGVTQDPQTADGLGQKLTGTDGLETEPVRPSQPNESGSHILGADGMTGCLLYPPPYAHTHTHTSGNPETPFNSSSRHPAPEGEPQAISAGITARLLEAKAAARASVDSPAPGVDTPAPKPSRRLTPEQRAERDAAKAEAKRAELLARISEAAGPLVELPALVMRDGAVHAVPLAAVPQIVSTFGMLDDLTIDVEHTGYPIGHADYALRTIQIGNDIAALVLDADDAEQATLAGAAVRDAARLGAYSAGADIVPMAVAGLVDAEDAWRRMFDPVIPAKLADPTITGSVDGLKEQAEIVLRDEAASPAADEARSALFKAGKWLTKTEATTPLERSGWAQVDRRCTTMVRYAASDVLDAAALAKRLPAVPPAVLERERAAQRMTARVALHGLRIDGEHTRVKHAEQRTALEAAGARLRAFGVENPGSDQQVAAVAIRLGARLPATDTGRPSVAAGALEPLKAAEGPLGDFVRARLDYQKAETALGLFLEPYRELVERGDGRARPTVYTLEAATGRMSCRRPNLQQVPREGGFRACITADPGHLLVSADFSGVELRVAAALSGDSNLRAMLAAGVDVHGEVAKLAFGPDATKADRYATKRGVFGRIYGGAIPAIARGVGVSEQIAGVIVDALDTLLPELAGWSNSVRNAVKNGHTQFPTYAGRVVHLSQKRPHAAPNYCIQGTARELLVDTLVRWQDTRWGNAVLLPVHDELVVMVPEAEAEAATAALVAAMETEIQGVRILAEPSAPSFAWKDSS